jgi:hypothetical protein
VCLTEEHRALIITRHFRAPYPTSPDVGLIDGCHVPMPGDVSSGYAGNARESTSRVASSGARSSQGSALPIRQTEIGWRVLVLSTADYTSYKAVTHDRYDVKPG